MNHSDRSPPWRSYRMKGADCFHALINRYLATSLNVVGFKCCLLWVCVELLIRGEKTSIGGVRLCSCAMIMGPEGELTFEVIWINTGDDHLCDITP